MSTVCVLPHAAGSSWVWWHEGHTLLLWEGQAELAQSRRVLDLRRDVVATEKDVRGSTFLVTRPWVEALTRRCTREGVTSRIRRSEL